MKSFLIRMFILLGCIVLVLACVAIGTALGVGKTGEELRKVWFEIFGLLGSWLSGIGALAAAYVALHIAERQQRDIVFRERVRALHHTMAVVNDLRGRVTYLTKLMVDGVGGGARQNVDCQGPGCGRYSITAEAIRRLAEGGPNKEVLVDMVRRANDVSRVLDIFVAEDGLVQTGFVG